MFGPFIIISLIYAVIAVRVVGRLVGNWRDTFDRRFTRADRSLVDEAAFFVLVPVSVALHELGHAAAIWSLGGEVLDFGFFGFAGYVSYNPVPFSDAQQWLIAVAGPFVNLLLSAGAAVVVFLRHPPARAAINELLIQFAILSGANAFIFYPVLDLLSNLNGDWRQMYFSGVPTLTAVTLLVHVGALAAGWYLLRDPGMKRRLAALTAVPRGFERGPLGGTRPATDAPADATPLENLLSDAGSRVAGGWPDPVQTVIQRGPEGSVLVLAWTSGRLDRSVLARTRPTGGIDVWGAVVLPGATAANGLRRSHLTGLPALPTSDDLTLTLRIAMETVETWGAEGEGRR